MTAEDQKVRSASGKYALATAALFNLAVAEPLFEVISGNATFLLFHRASWTDALLFASLMSLGIPLLMVSVCRLAGVFGLGALRLVFGVCNVFLAMALALVLMNSFAMSIPLPVGLASALLLGLSYAWLYSTSSVFQTFMAWLSVIALVAPVKFLLADDVAELNSARSDHLHHGQERKPPIVFVVFDELPTSSLMGTDHRLDRDRYPAFHRLAATSTWYRNATTAAIATTESLASILTGRYAVPGVPATRVHYTDNILAALGSYYLVRARETVTSLDGRARQGDGSSAETIAGMSADSLLIWAHIATPRELKPRLRSIDQTWGGFVNWRFWRSWRPEPGQPEIFQEFVSRASASDGTFDFIHVVFPHVPWDRTSSLKRYVPSGILGLGLKAVEMWGESEFYALQGYRRHLMQVEATDLLLGQLLNKLDAEGGFDDSLIIVTADHGSSHHANESRRDVRSVSNPSDILNVPLFIKLPHQAHGEVKDNAVQTIDIVPTIADVVGVELAWELDGESLLGPGEVDRQRLRVLGHDWASDEAGQASKWMYFEGSQLENLFEGADFKNEHFPAGSASWVGEVRSERPGSVPSSRLESHPVGGRCTIEKSSSSLAAEHPDDVAVSRVVGCVRGVAAITSGAEVVTYLREDLFSRTPLIDQGDQAPCRQAFSVMLPELTAGQFRSQVAMYLMPWGVQCEEEP